MEQDKLFKYLEGKLSRSEDLKVQLWLASHGDDKELQSMLDVYFDGMETADDSKEIDKELAALEKKLGVTRKWDYRRWLFAAVAAIAVVLLPMTGYRSGVKSASEEQIPWSEMNVPKGQTAELTLSDGTVLSLNSGTKIVYPQEFRGRTREIIVDGEVLAEVAKDPDRPFLIKSGPSTIKVTGTKFDFKSYEQDKVIEIALLEGSVDYSWKTPLVTRTVSLEAGNLMKLDKNSADISVSQLNVASYKTFNQNRSIHFLDEPLSDIAAALERVFDTKIVIMDESLAKTHYFAYFLNNEGLDEILNALNASGAMAIGRHDNVITISRWTADQE